MLRSQSCYGTEHAWHLHCMINAAMPVYGLRQCSALQAVSFNAKIAGGGDNTHQRCCNELYEISSYAYTFWHRAVTKLES